MDVADWLRSLGLERYEQAFRDNEFDADLLPNLTADDLKDLGVSLVGHRRRLLDAMDIGEAAPADRSAARMVAGARYPAQDFTPQQRRARTLAGPSSIFWAPLVGNRC